MGWVLAHHFLGMNDLHYGYWPAGLPVVPGNLAAAQAHYTELLMSRIPAGVRSILDVGMGAGTTARKLVEKGYRVDGVSPNGVLTDVARQQLVTAPRFRDAVSGSAHRPPLRSGGVQRESAVHSAGRGVRAGAGGC